MGSVNITDRANRILGHVVVDNVLSVTGTILATQNGAWSVAQSDATNPWIVVGGKPSDGANSPTLFKDLGATSGHSTAVVSTGSHNVFSLSCINTAASTKDNGYIQLHNKATVASVGNIPIFSFLVPPGAQIIVGTDFFSNEGVNFPTGLVFAYSETVDTYTAAPAGNQSTWIQYK